MTESGVSVERFRWWDYILHPFRTSCRLFDEANRIAQSGRNV
jgi:hypothetical protein